MTAEGPFTSPVHQSSLAEEAFFFDLSLDLLAVVGLDGYFKRINPMFSQTLGYSATELLTSPFLDFVHPDDRAATLAEMEQLKGGTPTLAFENRYLTREGDYRWLSWTASPQLDRAVIYCVARDVTQQKQTEIALRVSEERWQLALRGSNDGIWDWNVQTNEVFFSARWKTMLGYEEDEISHHLEEWAKRVHPDDLAWVMQAIQDHFAQKTPFYVAEHRVQCKDGGYKWILDRGQAIWDQDGKVLRMVGSHTDVTERKTLEAALRTANETLEQRVAQRTAELEQINRSLQASELKFRTAIEHIPDVFVIYDAHRRIQFVNRAGLALSGGSLPDFLGRRDEEIFPVEVTQTYLPLLQQAVATKRYQTGECTIALPNREPYTIVVQYVPLLDGNGEIQQIFGISHDITRRKQAEDATRRSEQQIRRILDSLFSFVGVMTPDGILIEANRTALEAAALRPADVLGKPFEDTYWWSYSPELQTQLRQAITRAAQGEMVRYDAIVRVREDQLITIDFTLGPIFDEAGRVKYLIPSGIDITERKQAEIALQQSQSQVQRQLAEIETIYQSAPIGLNILDTDLRFVRINQRLADMNGFSVEEHLGKTIRDLLPDLADTAEALLRPILATGEPLLNVEIRGETPAQPGVQQIWLESFLPLKQDDRIIGISTVCEEITERKQAEEALRRSEERYRTLFETMEDGFCVIEILFDANQTPIDYRFLEINPAFEQQTGLHQAVGKTARQLIPNLEDFWFETYGRVALTGEPLRFENGSAVMNRWFEVYAFPVGQPEHHKVALLFKEISERKRLEAERQQAEIALRENEDRLRMAIASAQLGTWDWNIVTGKLKWDTGCKAMFGLGPDAEINMETFFAGVHPQDREQLKAMVQSRLNPASGGSFDTEYRTIGLQDKVERWLRSKGQAYYDANGNPLRFSGTVLDITQQKQAEAHREQLLQQEQAAREAAERANRIKDEFLAVLSHELRTPLNPILGWSKLLQSPQISAQKLQQGLATIERNAKQQVQLIDDLLDTSRIIRGQLSLNLAVINLSEPILAALETVRLSAETKEIKLEVKLGSWLGQIRGDVGRLQQVVWNLLSNAIKFTPPGGRITVRLSQVDRWAQIQVRDTGKGIQPQFLPHVFELFRQEDSSTTRSFGGLGLGLAIARQVVEAHGGTIMAASQGEGQGATFTVLLPLIPAAITNVPADPQPQPLNIEQLRVMVVDDEADSLEVVKVVLEQQGAIVQALPSAPKALQLLTEVPFDLLVSDIGMPEMDGYTFIRQVRTLPSSLNRNIPAIALTAYASDMDQHQALSTGYQFHLAKPLEPEALVRAITRLGLPRPD
uniref:histidine kinase n=1 Tax=Cyanothece sp. (strain PCC 7425 / ATCC 29141) TaxID=395961 RepID=B8HRH4_CYAP4